MLQTFSPVRAIGEVDGALWKVPRCDVTAMASAGRAGGPGACHFAHLFDAQHVNEFLHVFERTQYITQRRQKWVHLLHLSTDFVCLTWHSIVSQLFSTKS